MTEAKQQDVFTVGPVIDQRESASWRFRAKETVVDTLTDGRRIIRWRKGMPVPPWVAVEQGVVAFGKLTLNERAQVRAAIKLGLCNDILEGE